MNMHLLRTVERQRYASSECVLHRSDIRNPHQAVADGKFADEIIPIQLKENLISVDDTIRQGVTLDGLQALKPVFPQWGGASTTAGNASGVGDGAGICILSSRARAEKEGMEIVGKYVASTVVGLY